MTSSSVSNCIQEIREGGWAEINGAHGSPLPAVTTLQPRGTYHLVCTVCPPERSNYREKVLGGCLVDIFYATKQGKVPLRDARTWDMHIKASAPVEPHPAELIAETEMRRGWKLYYIYDRYDPNYPKLADSDRWGQAVSTADDDFWRTSRFHVIVYSAQAGTRLRSAHKDRVGAVGEILKQANTDRLKGYAVETWGNVRPGVEPPPPSWESFLANLLAQTKHADAARLTHTLQEIQRMRQKLVVLDEIESDVRRKLGMDL